VKGGGLEFGALAPVSLHHDGICRCQMPMSDKPFATLKLAVLFVASSPEFSTQQECVYDQNSAQ
jgi:hypothetical protein